MFVKCCPLIISSSVTNMTSSCVCFRYVNIG
jgi:hypothetical protein